MSQICRYYLKGICKYGSRCHFLHENNEYKENYSGYTNSNHNNKFYNKTTNLGADEYRSNYHYNYSRYHVDNRKYKQADVESILDLPEHEILDAIRQELREFEERYVWFLTVIAPLKELGNIPGFKDFSPEEVRFQYYESTLNNSIQTFTENLKVAKNNVARICELFKTKSQESYETLRIMLQKSSGLLNEEMPTDSAFSFKFDLNSLPQQSCFATQPVQTNENSFASMPVNASPDVGFAFPTTESTELFPNNFNSCSPNIPVMNPTQDLIYQPNSTINSFSFNLNKLQQNHSNSPSVFINPSPFNVPNVNISSSNSNTTVFDCPTSSINSKALTGGNSAFNSLNGSSNHISNSQSSNLSLTNISIYSKSDEITSEALAAFQANTFNYGHIPMIPPSRELCFN